MANSLSSPLTSHIASFTNGKQRNSSNINLSHKLKSSQLQLIIEISTFAPLTLMEKPPFMKSKRMKTPKRWKSKTILIHKIPLLNLMLITKKNQSELFALTKLQNLTHQFSEKITQLWQVSIMQLAL